MNKQGAVYLAVFGFWENCALRMLWKNLNLNGRAQSGLTTQVIE